MKSIIISAFPGTGKSYMTQKGGITDGVNYWNFHDSDSSKFSWLYDEQGNKTNMRDPAFPKKLYGAHQDSGRGGEQYYLCIFSRVCQRSSG